MLIREELATSGTCWEGTVAWLLVREVLATP
jgi:hypothetical protein